MKISLLLLNLFLSTLLFSQSEQNYLTQAENAVRNSQFSEATEFFELAFEVNESSSYLDYYYAALSAANIQKDSLAISWLMKSAQLGLGTKKDEIDYISKQDEFLSLHNTDAWSEIFTNMNANHNTKILKEEMAKEKWLAEISIGGKNPDSYHLKFIKHEGAYVPYIIYYPSTYEEGESFPLVTFLHGGYGSTWYYQNYTNPKIMDEPIFQSADELGVILIYPFARENLNWVDSEKALLAIQKIVTKTINEINIDSENVIIGGMSTGGRATYWFTQQDEIKYTGYFSFSGFPSLKFLDINMEKFITPFISVHSRNDDIFKIDDIIDIHRTASNTYWTLRIIEESNHGLIYDIDSNGSQILTETISHLLH